MSKERAIKALKWQPTDMIPSMEFLTGLSHDNLLKMTGIDPFKNYHDSLVKLIEIMEIDLHGPLPDPPSDVVANEDSPETYQKNWGLTDGQQVEDGARVTSATFNSPDDVLKFDPLAWDKRSEDELFKEFSEFHIRNQNIYGDRCIAEEDIYTTLFHWCIDVFGWEHFMMAATMDEKRFEQILLQFKELTIRRTSAWSRVKGLEFFMCHDDLCMTRGPVFAPDWYRKYIFPHYADIIAPLQKASVPTVLISDGNYIELADDITVCGFDGLVFEQSVDIKAMVETFGGKKLLFGGPDVRILTTGTVDDVKKHLAEVFDVIKGVPGIFYVTGGSLPENLPYDNLKTYIDLGLKLRVN